jgi:hypothetical protein
MSETAETAGHNGAESDLKLNRDYWLLYVGFLTLVFVAVRIFNLYKDLFEEVALTRAPKYVYNLVNVLFSVFMIEFTFTVYDGINLRETTSSIKLTIVAVLNVLL